MALLENSRPIDARRETIMKFLFGLTIFAIFWPCFPCRNAIREVSLCDKHETKVDIPIDTDEGGTFVLPMESVVAPLCIINFKQANPSLGKLSYYFSCEIVDFNPRSESGECFGSKLFTLGNFTFCGKDIPDIYKGVLLGPLDAIPHTLTIHNPEREYVNFDCSYVLTPNRDCYQQITASYDETKITFMHFPEWDKTAVQCQKEILVLKPFKEVRIECKEPGFKPTLNCDTFMSIAGTIYCDGIVPNPLHVLTSNTMNFPIFFYSQRLVAKVPARSYAIECLLTLTPRCTGFVQWSTDKTEDKLEFVPLELTKDREINCTKKIMIPPHKNLKLSCDKYPFKPVGACQTYLKVGERTFCDDDVPRGLEFASVGHIVTVILYSKNIEPLNRSPEFLKNNTATCHMKLVDSTWFLWGRRTGQQVPVKGPLLSKGKMESCFCIPIPANFTVLPLF